MTLLNLGAWFTVCYPELEAIDLVQFILNGCHLAAQLAFPPVCGDAFSFPHAGWGWFSFLAHTPQRDLRKEQRLKNKPVNFSTLWGSSVEGWTGRSLQPLADMRALLPVHGHPLILSLLQVSGFAGRDIDPSLCGLSLMSVLHWLLVFLVPVPGSSMEEAGTGQSQRVAAGSLAHRGVSSCGSCLARSWTWQDQWSPLFLQMGPSWQWWS